MTRRETQAQWDEARAIAVRYADETHHFPADKVRAANPRLPFLFKAALPGASAVLVHGGKVVDAGGLEGLGAYLDAVDIYADRALTADDVLDLVYVFAVFPPVDPSDASPRSYVTDDGMPLSMRADWRGNELAFTLAYRLDRADDPDTESSPDGDEPTVLTVALWTLHLTKGSVPRWTEQRRAWDYTAERFVD